MWQEIPPLGRNSYHVVRKPTTLLGFFPCGGISCHMVRFLTTPLSWPWCSCARVSEISNFKTDKWFIYIGRHFIWLIAPTDCPHEDKVLSQVQEHCQHPHQEHAGRLHRCHILLGNRLGIGLWRGWQSLLWRIWIFQLLDGVWEVSQVVLPGNPRDISEIIFPLLSVCVCCNSCYHRLWLDCRALSIWSLFPLQVGSFSFLNLIPYCCSNPSGSIDYCLV